MPLTFWIKTNIKKCEWLVTHNCSDLSSNRYSIKFYSQLLRGGTPKVAFSWCLRWLVSTPSTVELKTIYDPLREEQEKHPPGLRFHSLRHLRNCLQSKSDNFKQANYGRKNPGCRSTLFMKIQCPKLLLSSCTKWQSGKHVPFEDCIVLKPLCIVLSPLKYFSAPPRCIFQVVYDKRMSSQ